MTEWGNLNLIEKDPENEIDDRKISLPGVLRGDHSSRSFRPEIQVSCVSFSPTARAWSACTTEGLLIYSLDSTLIFDPFDLDVDITPRAIRENLDEKNYSLALIQSLRLNEEPLIALVVEKTPHTSIEIIIDSLSDIYVDKLISFLACQIEKSAHLEFYLKWSQLILYKHGNRLKQRATDKLSMLCSLEKSITKKFEDLNKMYIKNFNYSKTIKISLYLND